MNFFTLFLKYRCSLVGWYQNLISLSYIRLYNLWKFELSELCIINMIQWCGNVYNVFYKPSKKQKLQLMLQMICFMWLWFKVLMYKIIIWLSKYFWVHLEWYKNWKFWNSQCKLWCGSSFSENSESLNTCFLNRVCLLKYSAAKLYCVTLYYVKILINAFRHVYLTICVYLR